MMKRIAEKVVNESNGYKRLEENLVYELERCFMAK